MEAMAVPDLTLAAQYIRHIANFLRSMGTEVERWLELSELNNDNLEDSSFTLSMPQFRQLMLDGIRIAREPALGLFIGERLVARTHGFVGYAIINSRTIREVLEVIERFLSLRISVLASSYEVHSKEVRLVLTELFPLGDIQRPVVEAVLMAIKNLIDAVSMGTCSILSAHFPFAAPDYTELAQELLGCEVRYNQDWIGLALPAEVLDVPLKMADPNAFEEAERICQKLLNKLEANETTTTRVRRLLLEKQNGFPSLQATARLLHMTPRTLHRRLTEEGTTYRAILEDVRYRLASDHLRSGHSSIEEIAYMLGYTDSANFRRAFKRWASVPPSTYRARSRL